MTTASRNVQLHTGSKDAAMLENPFAEHSPEGQGWKGKLGRIMVRCGKTYWLGSDAGDEGWMNDEIALGSMGRNELRGAAEREGRQKTFVVARGGGGDGVVTAAGALEVGI